MTGRAPHSLMGTLSVGKMVGDIKFCVQWKALYVHEEFLAFSSYDLQEKGKP